MRRAAILFAAMLLTPGCESIFGSDDPTMTGAWATQDADIEVTLTESDDGSFVGAGTIDYAFRLNVPVEVRGVNAYPSVSMSIIDRNGRALNFQGGFDGDDWVRGTVSGYSDGSSEKTFSRR